MCHDYLFVITFQVTRSVQAKSDTESSVFSKFWIPACAGMTALMALLAITTRSLSGNDLAGHT